jgi:hypothetical protein
MMMPTVDWLIIIEILAMIKAIRGATLKYEGYNSLKYLAAINSSRFMMIKSANMTSPFINSLPEAYFL